MAIILIGGGARSGKSRYALERARAIEGTRAFVATAQPSDEEMTARIRHHREERGDAFTTIEEPIDLPRIITEAKFDVLVIDCLTLWLSNIMFAAKTSELINAPASKEPRPQGAVNLEATSQSHDQDGPLAALEKAAHSASATIIFVTNEVGSGIIPTDHALSRDFRDRAGILNQRIASIAQEVYWMIFGLPQRIK